MSLRLFGGPDPQRPSGIEPRSPYTRRDETAILQALMQEHAR